MNKPKDAIKWVTLASVKHIAANAFELERRPALGHVWAIQDKTLAADGYRMHYIDSILPEAETPSAYPDIQVPDFISLIPSKREYSVSVSTWALVQALQACKPFARDASNISRWSVNGSLELAATSAEYGDVRVSLINGDKWLVSKGRKTINTPIAYSHIGPDIEFGINCKYALEALSGMGEQTTIWYQSESKPFLFTSGERHALVMPMHISR